MMLHINGNCRSSAVMLQQQQITVKHIPVKQTGGQGRKRTLHANWSTVVREASLLAAKKITLQADY
jgi:hypothetical protein